MPIQIGRKKQVPIYETTTTTAAAMSESTMSNYFTITQGSSYGWSIIYGTGAIVLKPSNVGVNSSTATITLKAVRDLTNLQINGEYYTEKNYDKITLTVARKTILDNVSGEDGPSDPTVGGTLSNYVPKRTISKGDEIVFKYTKDSSNHHTNEKYTDFSLSVSAYTTTVTTITGYEDKLLSQTISDLYLSPTKKVIGGWIKNSSGARQFYANKKTNSILYSGSYNTSTITIENIDYDLFELTTSGILTIGNTAKVWICGGGGGGIKSYKDKNNYYYSGGGGAGGYIKTGTITEGAYNITIGAGGSYDNSGGETSITNYLAPDTNITANGGGSLDQYASSSNRANGGSGGSGGGSGCKIIYMTHAAQVGTGAGVSTYPFGLTSLKAHCAGGGGGSVWGKAGGDGGSNGSDGKNTNSDTMNNNIIDTYYGGVGGEYGGGTGGHASIFTSGTIGSNGTFYGAGGGGGGFYGKNNSYEVKVGGQGYQGVVYVAIPK